MAPDQLPLAVHVLAFVEFHVRVELPFAAIEVGFAVSVTVGTGITVTEALCCAVPPVPVQLNV